ncbi:NmrA-like family domain-containing protein 1 [Talaromyces islandicus]|uniref:NmrA-like family domain-containing protein 1 n=1 Tax=Talaromyces islandicus TaxID=28573 RepID=A0A0U1LMJ3_TALIS|nr:NmrA-like family domain-containing protein 1 [Talaromyces islandicus]
MSQIITVFGATGNQGGSVIRAIQNDAELSSRFKIRAVTRNASSTAAQELATKGVEVVQGDLSSHESVKAVVTGAHTVFLVTNFWEDALRETEVSQGKTVADACKAAGIQHLIYSSMIDASEASNGAWVNIPHFDAKAEVERYIRESAIPATFVLAGTFMTEFVNMLQKQGENYVIYSPLEGNSKIPCIDIQADMGLFVKGAIKNREKVLGKQIYASVEYYNFEQLVNDFSNVTGKPAAYMKVPGEAFKTFLPENKATEVYETLMFIQDFGYYAGADLTESLDLLDEKPTEWKDFVEKNREKWE